MKIVSKHVIVLTLLSLSHTLGDSPTNLTCYQCIRNGDIECEPHELLPCPAVSDRCVTHISKSPDKGFSIKRECGLGPCSFDDPMVNKGLGFGSCDRSRDEYSCVLCCRESGCNKSRSSKNAIPFTPLISFLVCLFLLFFSK